MSVTVSTSDLDDMNPVTLAWKNHEHGDVYRVRMWLNADGAPTVQVDTPDAAGRLRVNLNDSAVFDGDPAHEHVFTEKTETHSLCDECGMCDEGI